MRFKILLLGLSLCTINCAIGQNNKVVVDRYYDKDLTKVSKGSLNIRIADSLKKFKTGFEYNINDRKLGNIYGFNPLPSSKLGGKMIAEYPIVVAKLGLNYPMGFDGSIFFQPNIFKSDTNLANSLTFSFEHSSDWAKRKLATFDIPDFKLYRSDYKSVATNSLNHIGIDYTHEWTSGELNLDAYYKRVRSSFYGIDHKSVNELLPIGYKNIIELSNIKSFVNNNLKKIYNKGGINFNIQSLGGEDAKFWYNVNLSYSNTSDKSNVASIDNIILGTNSSATKQNENYIFANIEAGPTIGKYSMVTFNVRSESAFHSGVQKFNASLLNIGLQYQMYNGNLFILLGGEVSFSFNNKKGYDKFHNYLLPNVSVELSLLDDKLWAYGKANGTNYLNNYSYLLDKSEWVFPMTEIIESSTPLNARIGLKGFLLKDLSFDIFAGTAIHKGLQQFTTYYDITHLDNAISAPLTASYSSHDELYAGGELTYSTKRLTLGGNTTFSSYSKYSELLSFPKFRANIFGEYNFRERIYIGAIGSFRSKTLATKYNNPTYSKSYFNLGAYTRYVIDNNFTAFVQVNNILNSDIQIYGHYLDKGINGSIGLLIKF